MSKQSAASSNPPQPENDKSDDTELVRVFYDGEKIILPKGFHHKQGQGLLLFFTDEDDREAWEATLISMPAMTETWDNEEDAVYDNL